MLSVIVVICRVPTMAVITLSVLLIIFGLFSSSVVANATIAPVKPVVLQPILRGQHRNVSSTGDSLMKTSAASGDGLHTRYQPDLENQYHLFTRVNPTVSQPLVMGNWGILSQSNYNPELWTIILIHGRTETATSPSMATLVPAFLSGEPCNVVVVDWSAGSDATADMMNAVYSAESIARFLNWLISTTGGSPDRFHVVGYSLGAQSAGNVGRFMNGQLAYITGLDPAFGQWPESDYRFQPTDAQYTEVIHTGAGELGYPEPLAQADFYPNGGVNMPGCELESRLCDHDRAFHYLAESLTGGTFTGVRCASYEEARESNCTGDDTLIMGGPRPKIGGSGIFWLETNAAPPFARG